MIRKGFYEGNAPLKRLLMHIHQNKKLINSWQLNDLLLDFASSYYKYDLLYTIYSELESGVNPENIVIFDKSV